MASTIVNIEAYADAYYVAGYPAYNNEYLNAGKVYNSGVQDFIAGISFDLSTIPDNKIITKIEFYGYCYSMINGYTNRAIDVYGSINEVDETTFSPGLNYTTAVVLNAVLNSWANCDITAFKSVITDNKLSLRLRTYDNPTSGDPKTYAGFYSRTGSSPVYLKVTYEDIEQTPPSNLQPNGSQTAIDRTVINRLSWYTEATQASFDLQWTSDSGATWNTVTGTIANQYVDIASNTFPLNTTIQWKVKIVNSLAQSSDYSNTATFLSKAKPTLAGLSCTNNTAYPTVSWTAVTGQTALEVEIYQGATLIATETATQSGNTYQIKTRLNNSTAYGIKVRVKDLYLWSAQDTVNITTSYTMPSTPTFTLVENTNNAAAITITNPVNAVNDYNQVLRKKSTDSDYVIIATDIALNGSYIDYAIQSGVEYNYVVRTVATTGGIQDSAADSITVTVKYAQLITFTGDVFDLKYALDKVEKRSVESSWSEFSGRTKRVLDTGLHKYLSMSFKTDVITTNDINVLRDLEGEILMYRDNRGRFMYCAITSVDITDISPDLSQYEASFTADECDYIEGV